MPGPKQRHILIPLALCSLAAAFSCASDEVCDWDDNDRDGIIDEGFDADGDGYWACGITAAHYDGGEYDCDDSDAAVNPSSDERCNGVDDDCDGAVDTGCAAVSLSVDGELVAAQPWDLNGDEVGDLVLSVRAADDGRALLYQAIGDGQGSFELSDAFSGGVLGTEVVTTDLEGDGAPDLLAAAPLGLAQYVPRADGGFDYTFHELWDPEVDGWRYTALAGDGLDPSALWVLGQTFMDGQNRLWQLRFQGGAWALSAQAEPSGLIGRGIHLIAGDIDGDGASDLIAYEEDTIEVWLAGEGGGIAISEHRVMEGDIAGLGLLDVEGDGDLDLIVSVPWVWRLYALPFEDGSFGSPLEISGFRHSGAVAVANFDGQGLDEIAVASQDEPLLSLYRNGPLGLEPHCTAALTVSEVALIPTQLDPAGGPGSEEADLVVLDIEAGTLLVVQNPCPSSD